MKTYIYKYKQQYYIAVYKDKVLQYYDVIYNNMQNRGEIINGSVINKIHDGYIIQDNNKKFYFANKNNFKLNSKQFQIKKISREKKYPEVSSHVIKYSCCDNIDEIYSIHIQRILEYKLHIISDTIYANVPIPPHIRTCMKNHNTTYKYCKSIDIHMPENKNQINMPDGSYIIIEQTAANVGIDINRGGSKLCSNTINKNAWSLIYKYVLVEQIYGVILIDFLQYDNKELTQEIDKCLYEVIGKCTWFFSTSINICIIARQNR